MYHCNFFCRQAKHLQQVGIIQGFDRFYPRVFYSVCGVGHKHNSLQQRLTKFHRGSSKSFLHKINSHKEQQFKCQCLAPELQMPGGMLPACGKNIKFQDIFQLFSVREFSLNFLVVSLSLLCSQKLVILMKTVSVRQKHKKVFMHKKCTEKSEDHALTETSRDVAIISIKHEIYRINTNFRMKTYMTLSCALKIYLVAKL